MPPSRFSLLRHAFDYKRYLASNSPELENAPKIALGFLGASVTAYPKIILVSTAIRHILETAPACLGYRLSRHSVPDGVYHWLSCQSHGHSLKIIPDIFWIPPFLGHTPETAPAFLGYRPSLDVKNPPKGGF